MEKPRVRFSILRQQLYSLLVEFRLQDVISLVKYWKDVFDTLPTTAGFILSIPLAAAYFFYIYIPWLILSWLWGYLILFLQVICRRSKHAKKLLILVSALIETLSSISKKLKTTKLGDLLQVSRQMIADLIQSLRNPSAKDRRKNKHSLSITELTELLAYEEIDEPSMEMTGTTRQRSHRVMHHVIPTNPFRATVRRSKLNSSPEKGTPNNDNVSTISNRWDNDMDSIPEEVSYYIEKDSPTSFPTTPFSRARIMYRSAERTDTVMFAARDRLRLEAQSASRDEYSRNAALEAQNSGQFAVFDPNMKSDGLALTCGNHCALKVGKGQCCSVHSMMPIRANAFVYFEFSVTVTGQQTPSLALGLAPPDCPLNVMVGSWPRSVGLYSDGQLLVGSRWFPDLSARPSKISAGTTIGILVYLRDPTVGCDQSDAIDPELLGVLASQGTMNKPSTSWSVGYGFLDSLSKLFVPPTGAYGENNTLNASGNNRTLSSSASWNVSRASPAITNSTTKVSTTALTEQQQQPQRTSQKEGNKENSKEISNKDNVSALSTLRTSSQSIHQASMNSLDIYGNDKHEEASSGRIHLRWNVNGQQSKFAAHALDSVADIISLKTPLYPTVSLLSGDTRVWCRFCEADIVYRSRSTIGAPPGVRVYCLDGSLLMDEKDG